MSEFTRIPIVVILRSRDQRLRDKRTASEIEALLELQALAAVGDMPPSMNRIAISLGWSRDKVRNAHARWQRLATDAGDPTACPALPVRS